MANEQKPSIGRIVHYTSEIEKAPLVYAAIITGVNPNGTVSLHVFYPVGNRDILEATYGGEFVKAGTEQARGMWVWPERV